MKDLKILFSEEEILTKIKELADDINKFYGNEEIYAICALKGGFMFASDLVKRLSMPLKIEFIRLSSYHGGTSSSGEIDAVEITLPDLNGKNILIIDDIVDTGLTAKFLKDYIQNKFNTKSTKFCSLLNKKARRKADIEPDFYCFDVDDKFLIGYGMDLDGYGRNLGYVGYKE